MYGFMQYYEKFTSANSVKSDLMRYLRLYMDTVYSEKTRKTYTMTAC